MYCLPMHYMFCVSGFSGVGKDEFCHRLVEKHGAVHTGLADPAKRHMADVYGFSRDQLFGPSAMRNAGDPRYPKIAVTEAGARLAEKSELMLDTSEDCHINPEKNWWCVDFDLSHRTGIGEDMTVIWGGSSPCVMIGAEAIPCRKLDGARIRIFFEDVDPRFFLSPREALQKYCNLMNNLYLCSWVRYGVDVHRKLAMLRDPIVQDNQVSQPLYAYDRMLGLYQVGSVFESALNNDCSRTGKPGRVLTRDVITCFSDFRHRHEIQYVREAQEQLQEGQFGDFKAILVRLKRPGIEKPPYSHRSETEQVTIPDDEFDFVVDNNADVEGLHNTVDKIVEMVKAGKIG